MAERWSTKSPGPGEAELGRPLVLTLALLASFGTIAIDMYLSSFPSIAADLGTGSAAVQLTLTAVMVGIAVGQLVLGPLSDRWGRRRPLMVSTAALAASSAACALAPSIEVLVAARVVQGFAGAAGVVIGRAIVADRLRGVRAARVFNLLVMGGASAAVLTPLLGGALVTAASWRGVFWAICVVAVVMHVAVLVAVPETLPAALRSTAGARAVLADLRALAGRPRFVTWAAVYCLGIASMFSYIAASPFVVQIMLGFSRPAYAVIFAVNSLLLAVSSYASSRLVLVVPTRRLLGVGLTVVTCCALALLVMAATGFVRAWAVLPLLSLTMAGIGLVNGNAMSLALAETGGRAGAGSSMIGAGQFLLAAAVSPLVGVAGEDSMLPMAVLMTATALAAVALSRTRRATGHRPDSGTEPDQGPGTEPDPA